MKHLLLTKLTFWKLVGKVNFLERKFEEMHQLWRPKRYKVHSGKRLFWHYCLQLPFTYKTVSQISFNLFCSGDKRLLSEFVRKWGQFQGHNERFPKNQNFKKLRHYFSDERPLITTTLISSCHWKTLVAFYLQKKRPENIFLTLTVNYRKIV